MKAFKSPKIMVAKKDLGALSETESFTENKDAVLNDGLGPKWMVWKRRRYIVVFLAFLGEVTKETLRTNLSVAVFPMSENHSTTHENGTTTYTRDFDWDVKTRGFLLSVFYYGCVATHIPGGILALKYGGTKLYGLGIAVTAASTFLTPAAAYIHFYVLVALRIFEGLCEGILTPSMELVFARWIPRGERSMLIAFSGSGNSVGVAFGVAISSAISYRWGWSAVFYFTGGIGIAFCVTWITFVKEYPKLENNITPSELQFIQDSIGKQQQGETKMSSIPIKKMSKSLPFLALVCAILPIVCSYIMFSTQLPAYIKDVLKLDTENSGYMSSFAFAVKVLAMYCLSPLADWLVKSKVLATVTARKLYICGGLAMIAAMNLLIQQATTTMAVMGCLLVINMCCGSAIVQIIVNLLDIAPRYSSVTAGVLNTITAVCGMIIPTMIGYLTQNKMAREWHTVFSMQAAACMLSVIVYGVFGSAQLQPWATEKSLDTIDTIREEVL